MNGDLPSPAHDLRHLDPEVRRERVKLAASATSAFGLAFVIGSIVAPLSDPESVLDPRRAAPCLLIGFAFILAAVFILRYIRAKESA